MTIRSTTIIKMNINGYEVKKDISITRHNELLFKAVVGRGTDYGHSVIGFAMGKIKLAYSPPEYTMQEPDMVMVLNDDCIDNFSLFVYLVRTK